MKTFFALTVVGVATAHKPVPKAYFEAKAVPLTVENLGAMAESYHNAFKYCSEKTIDWIDELGVNTKDITFDNTYGGEYRMQDKVPNTYGLIKKYIKHYWDSPTIEMDQPDKKRILSVSYDSEGNPVVHENAHPRYSANDHLDWILEHNHPSADADYKTVGIKRTDQEYKDAYDIFYNI